MLPGRAALGPGRALLGQQALGGKPYPDPGAPARGALEADAGAVQLDQRADDGQADAGSLEPAVLLPLDLIKGFEDLRLVRRRDADAGVADGPVQALLHQLTLDAP